MTQEVLKLALEEMIAGSYECAIDRIQEALAQPQQEPVAREPNDAELLKAFTRSNNGPNPFYRCNTCGDTEPGVREYLSNHWLKHNNTAQPQRKPLTDEEIYMNCPAWLSQDQCKTWVRQIEAAHGIKE